MIQRFRHTLWGVRTDTTLGAFFVLELLGGVIVAFVFTITHAQGYRSSISGTSKYVAEFVGTFVLVVTVGGCVLTGSATWNATAIACILMVRIYATGPISGGNLNSAGSIASGLAGVA